MPTITLPLDDNRTIQAIGILADVLDGVSGPGGLDTVLVSKALRQVIATRSQPAFDFASRAFSTLDGQVKLRVAREAQIAARDAVELRGRVAGFLQHARRAPPTDAQPFNTGLLAALNRRNKT